MDILFIKKHYKLTLFIVIILTVIFRGLYVSSFTGISREAHLYKHTDGTAQLVVSSIDRSSSIMAETPIAAIFSILEQLIFHPTVRNEAMFCLNSTNGEIDISSVPIYAYGSKSLYGAYQFKQMKGLITINGGSLKIDLKHKKITSGSHHLLNRDGTFSFNGYYSILVLENAKYENANCE